MLEIFEVGPCENAYQMGVSIGQRFSSVIRSRISNDLILQNQLLPFAQSSKSQPLIKSLTDNNRRKFPNYWDELLGTAQGSGVPFLDLPLFLEYTSGGRGSASGIAPPTTYFTLRGMVHNGLLSVMLINFRKEILPFIPKTSQNCEVEEVSDDCSDVLVVSDNMAIAAHNEDANVALVDHTYLVKATMSNGLSFVGYTYAGELPSCAFGFNNYGLAFTLNSVPPSETEIVAGGIGRNFISRDLLEATSIDEALNRIHSSDISVGHSYNLIDISSRKILNVETASRNRVSVHQIGTSPFFHANMYLHLRVEQVQDDNSKARQRRANLLPKESKEDFLSLLGNMEDKKYPIYMTGPTLHTLCTAVIDLDDQTLSIIEGNPKNGKVSYVFSMSATEWKISQ